MVDTRDLEKLFERIICRTRISTLIRVCHLSEWQGRPIPLEIHHINGINKLLCPNCRALTDNYRGRAKLSALSEKRDVECRKFKGTLSGNAEGNLEPSL